MEEHYEKLTKMLATQSYTDLADPERRRGAQLVVRHLADVIAAAGIRPSNVISLDVHRKMR